MLKAFVYIVISCKFEPDALRMCATRFELPSIRSIMVIPEENYQQKYDGFDPNKPTKLLSHGYTDNGPRFCSDFVQAYENDPNETFNIICIDWQILAKADEPVFSGAAKNAVKVGKAVGEEVVAKMLIGDLGQDPNKIHAIGHSMGAQLVGNVGKCNAMQKKGLGNVDKCSAHCGMTDRDDAGSVGLEIRLKDSRRPSGHGMAAQTCIRDSSKI